MNIRLVMKDDQLLWDAYVNSHDLGTAYHYFAWGNAVKKAYGFTGKYLIAEEDGLIQGVFPLVYFKRPLSQGTLISLPYCDVAGILADNHDISTLLFKKALELMQVKKAKEIEIRSTTKAHVEESTFKVRMVLDLPENSDELLAGMKSKLRSQIKKPVRDGLTAKLGGVELVDTFYNVFAENMHELGSPVHSRKWISAVVLEYGDRARVGVVFTPEGMPAAAGIILLHERIVSIPWASSLRKFNRLNPNMLLYWTFLSFAADNGFEKFDFGRSSPGEGTFKFKEQWGAMPQPLSWDYFSFNGEPVERFQTSSKMRGYLEKIWQRSPLPMCNFCGPLLRKYVSL